MNFSCICQLRKGSSKTLFTAKKKKCLFATMLFFYSCFPALRSSIEKLTHVHRMTTKISSLVFIFQTWSILNNTDLIFCLLFSLRPGQIDYNPSFSLGNMSIFIAEKISQLFKLNKFFDNYKISFRQFVDSSYSSIR